MSKSLETGSLLPQPEEPLACGRDARKAQCPADKRWAEGHPLISGCLPVRCCHQKLSSQNGHRRLPEIPISNEDLTHLETQLTGRRLPTRVCDGQSPPGASQECPERHTPEAPTRSPTAKLKKDGGRNRGTTSHNEIETGSGRPLHLTWEQVDGLSSHLSSSNVRSKDVTAFSFDDVQSLIVLSK